MTLKGDKTKYVKMVVKRYTDCSDFSRLFFNKPTLVGHNIWQHFHLRCSTHWPVWHKPFSWAALTNDKTDVSLTEGAR